MDEIMAVIIVLAVIFMGTIIVGLVFQALPTLFQLIAANAQGIVGIAEIAVAITLVFTAMVEGLPFLSVKKENIMHV